MLLTLHCLQFLVSVLLDELFDDDEATADSNYKTTIQHFSIDFLCAKEIVAITELLDWYRAADLINCFA